MPFRGELVDSASTPISGVFPLVFRLYTSAEATDAVWREERYVAVDTGMYDVLLGGVTPLPTGLAGQTMILAVDIRDGGEVTRFPLTIQPAPGPLSRAELLATLDVTFADLSDQAVLADRARVADDCVTLGGRRLEELDRFEELLTQIADLRREVDAATGPTIGSRTTTLERIGGAGGLAYARSCPPGHVVVGMRGGAGALIDSIELVCAPLE